MNNSVVIGHGVIGKATAEVFGISNYISRSDSNITYKEAAQCKYIFICLPTPTINGKCFTSDIYEAVKNLVESGLSKESIIIIRSTVYPGCNYDLQKSTRLKRIVSNPEFVNNDTATQDMLKPDLIVIGGDDRESVDQVVALYKSRFKYPDPVVTDSRTAEFIKYALNVFFASKVIIANQLFDGAQKLRANYDVARKVLEEHKWGSKNHLQVHHKGGRGAGGKCLKKDLEVFANLIEPSIFSKMNSINQTYLEMTEKE